MFCSRCGADNPDGAETCASCRTPMVHRATADRPGPAGRLVVDVTGEPDPLAPVPARPEVLPAKSGPAGPYPNQHGYPPPLPHGQQPPVPYGYPPAGPYGYPPVVYAITPPDRTNGLAIASLVLGALWLYWVGSILAVILGHIALSQIKRSRGTQSGQGLALAGVVVGWIGVGMLVVFWIVVAAASSSSSGF